MITFRGFLAAYEEGRDDDHKDGDDEERRLPNLAEGDAVTLRELEPQGHETNPPARYTEATLVRTLEELGIGRPSTYASILGTILDRGYVFKKGTALVPSFLAFAVVGLLEQHFGRLVDYDFTARMEDDLDRIASGDEQRVHWLRRFYFGEDDAPANGGGLKGLVSDLSAIDAREVNSIAIGEGIVLRVGRYGPYLERDGQRANVPDDVVPDELTVARAEELLAQPSGDRPLGTDPETGREIVARTGRYGPYVTEVLPEDATEKPRTASLFKSMAPDAVTLEDALQLLQLPRVVGVAEDGEEIVARNGRYGPYVQKGTESRSLETEEQLLTISARRGARRPRAAAPPPRPGRRGAAVEGARPGPGQRQADRAQGGPLRPVRHGRRDEREPPQGRRPGGARDGAGRRAARGAPGQGAGEEAHPEPETVVGAPTSRPAERPASGGTRAARARADDRVAGGRNTLAWRHVPGHGSPARERAVDGCPGTERSSLVQ